MTPGKYRKQYLAAALEKVTGKILHVIGVHKTHEQFLALLERVEWSFP
jgi:hypothetical protein